jgi:hypothetical protein
LGQPSGKETNPKSKIAPRRSRTLRHQNPKLKAPGSFIKKPGAALKRVAGVLSLSDEEESLSGARTLDAVPGNSLLV